jgi:predicted Zn-dependent peptidase
VKRISTADLRAWHERAYHPPQIVLAAAGNVTHEQLLDVLDATGWATRERGVSEWLSAPPPPDVIARGYAHVKRKDIAQTHLVLACDAPKHSSPERHALAVASALLGGGMSSRLFQEIREERGLAYSVSSFSNGYQDVGILGIYAGTTQQKLASLLDGLKRVLDTIEMGVTAAELLRAKNQLKAGVVMTRESSGAIAEWIARHLHVHGRYRTADEILEQIEAITPEDIRRVAAQSFRTTPAVAALGPNGSVNDVDFTGLLAA